MLKKKIAAMVAAVMTISSLGTVAFAADGDSYDKLLGNSLDNGTFENDVDWWGPTDRIVKEINNTYDGSAGAAFIKPGAKGAQPVHSKFQVTPNKYYHAEARVTLAAGTPADAELVIATIDSDGNLSTPLTTATKTVNSTSWTKIECDFVSETRDLAVYVKLSDENASFYLDNVIVKVTNYALPSGDKALVTVEDKNGNQYLAMKFTADDNGEVNLYSEVKAIGKGKKFISRVMLDKNVQATSVTANFIYTNNNETLSRSEIISLPQEEMVEMVFENHLTTLIQKSKCEYKISGAAKGDIIYYCGSGVTDQTATTEPADNVTAEITSFEALAGANTNAVIAPDENTVALRYFYYVVDENGNEEKIKTGHTNAGDTDVPSISLDSSYAGKRIKLVVEPMNKDLKHSTTPEVGSNSAIATVKAPFEIGEVTASEGTVSFEVEKHFVGEKKVAALVAYYNDKGEMVGIGIQNNPIGNVPVTYTVSLANGTATDDYKIFILDGELNTDTDIGDDLNLYPLAEAK